MGEESGPPDDWLRGVARRHYHPPEETPREELWDGIRRTRSAGDGSADDTGEQALNGTWSVPRWARQAAALAAAVAVGVILGRGTVGPLTNTSEDSAPGSGAAVGTAPDGAAASRSPGAAASPALQAATREVLQRAEVLLTGFRSDLEGPGVDRQTARWARDVLTTTRLLLDSRAARDPSTRELLRDLEIVLAQLAALPEDSVAAGAEAQIVSRGIEQRDVLSRIRMLDERRAALDR